MSREVLEMVEKMDKIELKNQLALQCAPLLSGIKPSNLLTLRNHSVEEVETVFAGTDITVQILCQTGRQTVLLLYREEELLAYINTPDVKQAMQRFGYRTLHLTDIFKDLCTHYETYMTDRESFPHELGLLLGYPVEDVLGFVENQGQNYLYSGYWKVYGDVSRAKALFNQYTEAKEHAIRMVVAGGEIKALLAMRQQTIAV